MAEDDRPDDTPETVVIVRRAAVAVVRAGSAIVLPASRRC